MMYLADVLKGMSTTSPRQLNYGQYLNDKFLPEFDPAKKTITASDWIDKINKYGRVYGWDDKVKMVLSGCRLGGTALLWYEGLTESFEDWEEYCRELRKQFPGEKSFGRLMAEVNGYISKPGQDLAEYCFLKLQKINQLKMPIQEDQKVDFIIYGIHDENIRTALLTAKLTSIADLNQMLSIFRSKTVALEKEKNTKEQNGSKYHKQSSVRNTKDRGNKNKSEMICHGCQKPGHFRRDCPDEKDGKGSSTKNNNKTVLKCGYCKAVGHEEAKCYKKQAAEAAERKK